MAAITFYGNEPGLTLSANLIKHGDGSGIGFYGAGFGISVAVGQKQESTWVTNSAGTNQGAQLNNTKYMSVSGVSSNTLGEIENEKLPNYLAPLNIRFEHSDPVRVQNCKLRIFDRNDIAKHASGVNTYVYEVRHPHETQDKASALAHRGVIADHAWKEYDPVGPSPDPGNSMVDTIFTSSPGVSGTNGVASDGDVVGVVTTDGIDHLSLKHDWYVALSASPDSIGSKTDYGLYFTCEYL